MLLVICDVLEQTNCSPMLPRGHFIDCQIYIAKTHFCTGFHGRLAFVLQNSCTSDRRKLMARRTKLLEMGISSNKLPEKVLPQQPLQPPEKFIIFIGPSQMGMVFFVITVVIFTLTKVRALWARFWQKG
jgi:hypothetical protein